jgi:uncharacterized protein
MDKMQLTFENYLEFLNDDKLMGSRCKRCGSSFLPPRPVCSECSSVDLEWTEMKREGILVAFTVITVGTSSMIKEGYSRTHPYCTGIVELEGGIRISARIYGFDVANPSSIAIGSPVQIVCGGQGRIDSKRDYLAFAALREVT